MQNPDIQKAIKMQQVKDAIISDFNSSVDQRVDRYIEIGHQWIIGNHHFAAASAECINLYRDGHFIAAVMMSHSINEGIIVFIAGRIGLNKNKGDGGAKSIEDLINELEQNKTISKSCADSARGIYGSYRNDVHHMSPKVSGIDFFSLAQDNLKRLAIIEGEIFGADITPDGKLKPRMSRFWDLNADGTVSAFLRLE
ncbi:MAG TPA: hypothetical protein PK263_02525 [bacterium]|nr:hypothetical protein [bacterium]